MQNPLRLFPEATGVKIMKTTKNMENKIKMAGLKLKGIKTKGKKGKKKWIVAGIVVLLFIIVLIIFFKKKSPASG